MRSSFFVFLGAGLGGVARHFFNAVVVDLLGAAFPWGTFLINVIGSTAMGFIVEWLALRGNAPADLRLFLTTGILGGFTTFSTFSLDSAVLYERGQLWLALIYIAASLIVSIGGLFMGMWIIRISGP